MYVLCYRFLCDASAAVPTCDPFSLEESENPSMYCHTPVVDIFVLSLGLELVT